MYYTSINVFKPIDFDPWITVKHQFMKSANDMHI